MMLPWNADVLLIPKQGAGTATVAIWVAMPRSGAPSLTDEVWLYGSRPEDIRRSISRGRAGMSPAFARPLTAAQLRNVAVYVASLARTQQDRK